MLYSSIAALLGSADQGAYAAANGFLAALAQSRSAAGHAGLSIQWGPWSGPGMAAGLGRVERRQLAATGLRTLAPGEYLAALSRHLGERGRLGLFAVDWRRYFDHLPGPVPDLLSGLISGDAPAEVEPGALRRSLAEAPNPAERRHRLSSFLRVAAERARVERISEAEAEAELERALADLA